LSSFGFRQIGESFACELDGVRLWDDLDATTVKNLRDLLGERGVIVLRRQSLREDELVRFAGLMGTLQPSVRYDWASKHERNVGYISNMRDPAGNPIGGLGSGEVVWHADQSYHENPVTGAMLYCVETPPDAGRTSWANLMRAYDALPDATKERIEDYVAIYSYEQRAATYEEKSRPSDDIRRLTPPVRHRMVNAHPRSGRKALYLDPGTVVGIEGLTDAAAKDLLTELNAHATQERFIYTHQWNVGDVLIWDNGMTLHRREPYDASLCRLMKRLQFRLASEDFICPT
jgi:alpha-ketoglutarate-dependent taurine dioxygenase